MIIHLVIAEIQNYLETFWIPIPFEVFHIKYGIGFFLVGYLLYLETQSKSFIQFFLPKKILTHPSTYIDLCVTALAPLSKAFLVIPMTFLSGILAAEIIDYALLPFKSPNLDITIWFTFIYSILWFLARDFGLYITHYWMHKSRILWEFHKIHHSAEVLNLATTFRAHPIDHCFTSVIVGFIVGLVYSFFSWLCNQPVNFIGFFEMHILVHIFYLVGANFRHSHIQFTYPKWLQCLLICPTQHQIHHSLEKKHWNKNYGVALAIWDYWLGTLYIAHKNLSLKHGLDGKTEYLYRSLKNVYLLPFKNAYRLIMKKFG